MQPVRNYIDEVATEIWLVCFQFCGKAELRRLSRVCHYFQALAQPLLFWDQTASGPGFVTLHTGNWRKITRGMHRNVKRLARLADSSHASSVRTWRFSGLHQSAVLPSHITNIHVFIETWKELLRVFTTTLGTYQRLTTLNLRNLMIDKAFRDTLSSLASLEDLTLTTCEVIARTGPLLHLRRFTQTGSPVAPSNEALDLFVAGTLEHLKLDSANCPSILAVLVGRILPNLIGMDITLEESHVALLLSVLHTCLRVETISLHHVAFQNSTVLPSRLPPSAIPQLKSFTGPPGLAGLLITARPVLHIELTDRMYGTMPSVVEPWVQRLHEISAPVSIHSLFPALRNLTVELLDTWPDEALDDDDDDDSVWVPPSVPVRDDGTLELSDDGTVDHSSGDSFYESDSDSEADSDSDYKKRAAFADLIPGNMYNRAGVPADPPNYPGPPTGIEKSLKSLMRSISNGDVVLPHDIEVLCFMQEFPYHLPSPFPEVDQHGAVLMLERLHPCIREIRFATGGDHWERQGNIWTRDYHDYPSSRARGFFKIVSLVWKEDGTRRDI
ncbi:hypothetical protein C8R43DRAFT_1240228 [Mycena crocata]|nr:hypothetical protein C8R43DRAFT_1240228 [Mycena crocata]